MAGDAPSRRRVLAALVLTPVLAGCGLLAGRDRGPDPLIVLADAARADADAAQALAAAEPELAETLTPVAAARREHADALDAEIARLDPDRSATPSPSPVPAPATLAALAAALTASGAAAVDVALQVPVERVGLVGTVAACCTAYATLLAPAAEPA